MVFLVDFLLATRTQSHLSLLNTWAWLEYQEFFATHPLLRHGIALHPLRQYAAVDVSARHPRCGQKKGRPK